eukprot:g21113.t1
MQVPMATPFDLEKVRGVKKEVVQSEDELGQMEEGGGGWERFRPFFQEESESPETILMRDGRVEGLHVYGKEEVAGACELEILKLTKCQRNHG